MVRNDRAICNVRERTVRKYSECNATTAINKKKLSLYTEAITRSLLSLTTTATDGIIGIGSKHFISDHSDQIGRLVGDGRAPGLCSHSSAISQHKDLYGSTIEILGWLFSHSKSNYITDSSDVCEADQSILC